MTEMIARVGDAVNQSGICSVCLTGEELVRCKDCKYRPKKSNVETFKNGFNIEFPEGSQCPCRCSGDEYYSWYPEDNWFCANGKRR